MNYGMKELKLDADLFSPVRSKTDLMIQRVLQDMADNEMDEGQIDIKINITLREQIVPGADGSDRIVPVPVIKHKVTGQVPLKYSSDGRNDANMEIVRDDAFGFVLQPIRTGQVTIDEYMRATEGTEDAE